MDVTSFVQLISTVGFPIACCIFMGWYVKHQTDQYRDDIASLDQKHCESLARYQESLAGVTEAVNNNTVAIQLLSQRLGGM